MTLSFHVFSTSSPLFTVVIEVPTFDYAVDNTHPSQWYVTMTRLVSIDVDLIPSVNDPEKIFWTFIPNNNNNSLSNVVNITEAPETASYSLRSDHLLLTIISLTSNEEGNYTIAVLDNLVTSTKTISLNILRKQFVPYVWHSGYCLLLLSSVCF